MSPLPPAMLYCSRAILNSQATNLGWGTDLQKNVMPWHKPGHQGSLNAFGIIIYDWQKGGKKEKSEEETASFDFDIFQYK